MEVNEIFNEINVLNIDKDSILVIYVDVSAQPPSKVGKICKKVVKRIKPLLKKRNIKFFLIPQRDGKKAVTFGVIKKIE